MFTNLLAHERTLSSHDLYHEDHPMHFLVLDEIEEWDAAMKDYARDCDSIVSQYLSWYNVRRADGAHVR